MTTPLPTNAVPTDYNSGTTFTTSGANVLPGLAPASQTATPTPNITINNPPNQYFTAEQLEAARQQEKDKLYGRLQQQDETINSFKSQLEELKADKAARDKAIADAAKTAEEAQRREQESKLSAEELIRAKEAELTEKQNKFSQDMELKIAEMAKEQEFLRLQAYIQRRVAEETAANTIIPELVEFIGGNTEDAVETSITKVKEKTANIVKGAATLNAPQMPTGVSPTGGPAGPLDNLGGPKQYSKEDIARMDMATYAQYRQQQGISGAGNNRGMFN
jgi:hypothetical protein